MHTDEKLKAETLRWLATLEKLKIRARNKKGEELLANINAYIKDSHHFLRNNDLIRAFEACIWAWALAQMGKDFKALELTRT
jgi:hypothetical protein